MKWEDCDLKKKLWIQPAEKTKSDGRHELPLSHMAVQIIEALPNMGDYLFTSSGFRPFENFGREKKRFDTAVNKKRKKDRHAPIQKWRIHDLRLTAASGMARLDTPPHVIERVLNHTSGVISGVAAVYNRHQYAGKMKKALDDWANHVQEILASKPSQSILIVPDKKKKAAS